MTRDRQQPTHDGRGESLAGASFGFEIRCPNLTPAQAWAAVVDVRRHAAVVPLTTIDAPALDQLDVGSRVVARTALGPFGFDDVMVVRELDPGRRVVFDKVGRVLGGTVTITVGPVTSGRSRAGSGRGAESGSCVGWCQSITLPWVPRPLSPAAAFLTRVAAPVIGQGYRLVVRRLLARAPGDLAGERG